MADDVPADAELVAYEDGDALVVCDPEHPRAWIRSDTTVDVVDAAPRLPTE